MVSTVVVVKLVKAVKLNKGGDADSVLFVFLGKLVLN